MTLPAAAPPLVIKLGGSLTRREAPRDLLARIAAGHGQVVVPGGGALADQVRAVQPHWELGDAAAHRMALLAMEQMAHAMLDIAPALLPARTPAEIFSAAKAGTALWFPAAMTLGAPDIPESWDVTSDSLAAWLARRLGARRLVLVKAAGVALPAPDVPKPDGSAPDRSAPAWPTSGADRPQALARLADAGIVDAAFAGMAQGFEGDIVIVRADDDQAISAALRFAPPSSGSGRRGKAQAEGDQRAS